MDRTATPTGVLTKARPVPVPGPRRPLTPAPHIPAPRPPLAGWLEDWEERDDRKGFERDETDNALLTSGGGRCGFVRCVCIRKRANRMGLKSLPVSPGSRPSSPPAAARQIRHALTALARTTPGRRHVIQAAAEEYLSQVDRRVLPMGYNQPITSDHVNRGDAYKMRRGHTFARLLGLAVHSADPHLPGTARAVLAAIDAPVRRLVEAAESSRAPGLIALLHCLGALAGKPDRSTAAIEICAVCDGPIIGDSHECRARTGVASVLLPLVPTDWIGGTLHGWAAAGDGIVTVHHSYGSYQVTAWRARDVWEIELDLAEPSITDAPLIAYLSARIVDDAQGIAAAVAEAARCLTLAGAR